MTFIKFSSIERGSAVPEGHEIVATFDTKGVAHFDAVRRVESGSFPSFAFYITDARGKWEVMRFRPDEAVRAV